MTFAPKMLNCIISNYKEFYRKSRVVLHKNYFNKLHCTLVQKNSINATTDRDDHEIVQIPNKSKFISSADVSLKLLSTKIDNSPFILKQNITFSQIE